MHAPSAAVFVCCGAVATECAAGGPIRSNRPLWPVILLADGIATATAAPTAAAVGAGAAVGAAAAVFFRNTTRGSPDVASGGCS